MVRKADTLSPVGGLGEKQMMGGWVLPAKPWNLTHPTKAVCPHHVISGIRLEFSSEALSPSDDFFLFRPPEKKICKDQSGLGGHSYFLGGPSSLQNRSKNGDKALDSLVGSSLPCILVLIFNTTVGHNFHLR